MDENTQTTTAAEVPQSIQQIDADTFRGTVQQFITAGLTVNGHSVDQAGLSALGRYELLNKVGEQKPARGRSAAVYEIKVGSTFAFKQ